MTLEMPSRPRSTLLSILAVWVIFYGSFTLFTPPLMDDADSVHAEVAREMLVRHDYVTLYANGIRYLEKAPLLYWSMAASFKAFGVSTAAARLPLALTMLALALAVEVFARRVFSARAGLYAALTLLASPALFIYSHLNIPDAMVALWLVLAMFCFWLTEAQAKPSRSLCWSFAAVCALNVLTKGLIGVVFPIAIVLTYLLVTRGLRASAARIRCLYPASSVAAFLAIAAPWHILVALANPTQGHPGNVAFSNGHFSVPVPTDGNVHGWSWFYFVNEHLLRYVNLRVPRDYDTVPLWLFWALCLIWVMPFSAYLFHAVTAALPLRSRGWRAAVRSHSLSARQKTLVLVAIWAGLPLLFFSLSTRQEYYVLPALPAFILLIADWLANRSGRNNGADDELAVPGVRIARVLVVLGGAGAVACVVLLWAGRTATADADLASLLQQNPAAYALSLGHMLDLNVRAMAAFRVPLALTAIAFAGGTLANFFLRRSKRPHAGNLSLIAGAFLFLIAVHLGLRTFSPVLSSQQFAATLVARLQPSDLIVIHEEYEFGSTLGFYLRRADIHILEGRSSNLWYGSFFSDAPAIFETQDSIARRWSGSQRIFLWQDLGNQPGPLPALPGPVYVIAKSGGKEIVSNRPDAPYVQR